MIECWLGGSHWDWDVGQTDDIKHVDGVIFDLFYSVCFGAVL